MTLDQLFPAGTLTTALSGGGVTTLPGSPKFAKTGTANGAASSTPDIYIPASRRIGNIILQLQAAANALAYNQLQSIFSAPLLRIEIPRRQATANEFFGGTDLPNLDLQTGHGFMFSDVEIFKVLNAGTIAERWLSIGAIKDESVSINNEETHVEWMKYKPNVTIHRARASFTDELTFRLDEMNPNVWAQALQTTPVVDFDDEVVRISHEARLSRVIEGYFVAQWRTLGLFISRALIPRGILTIAALSPGEQDFAGREVTLSGLATVSNKRVLDYEVSLVPTDEVLLPLVYATEEASA
jgi:hypothetical protein